MGGRSRGRRRPVWASWAYDLARDLVRTWGWLAGVPRPRVAATLGARLGPDWTAEQLAGWVAARRDRPVLTEPDDALAYLRAVLEETLTGDVVPPAAARRYDEHRAQVAEDAHLRAAAGHGALRAVFDERDAAAAAATGAGRAAARAVLADVAARRGPAVTECEWPAVAQPGGSPPLGR